MTAGLGLFQTGIPGGSLPVACPAIYGILSSSKNTPYLNCPTLWRCDRA
jgi:hypothetical protein